MADLHVLDHADGLIKASGTLPESGASPSLRVALYLRVSTEEQDLAGQERDVRTFAAAHGWSIAAVYAEKVSGTGRVERVEYDRLLRDAARPDRGWTILLVWALDRWSREERFDRAVGAVLDLEKAGVSFQSLKEPYLSTPDPTDANAGFARNLLLGITSSVAAFESRRKSERVRVAMGEIKAGRRATRSGIRPGRPTLAKPELVLRALALRDSGKEWATVAQLVGLKKETCRRSVRALRRLLRASRADVGHVDSGSSIQPTPPAARGKRI